MLHNTTTAPSAAMCAAHPPASAGEKRERWTAVAELLGGRHVERGAAAAAGRQQHQPQRSRARAVLSAAARPDDGRLCCLLRYGGEPKLQRRRHPHGQGVRLGPRHGRRNLRVELLRLHADADPVRRHGAPFQQADVADLLLHDAADDAARRHPVRGEGFRGPEGAVRAHGAAGGRASAPEPIAAQAHL